MSQGMTEGQKARTRTYLDDFKESNGGCIICGRKVTDYNFVPGDDSAAAALVSDGKPMLMMYGSCAGHAMVSNSDEVLAQAVADMLPIVKEDAPGKPVLMVVVFKEDGEALKCACEPVKKAKEKAASPPRDDGIYSKPLNRPNKPGDYIPELL